MAQSAVEKHNLELVAHGWYGRGDRTHQQIRGGGGYRSSTRDRARPSVRHSVCERLGVDLSLQ
jgi:hypothetical protein